MERLGSLTGAGLSDAMAEPKSCFEFALGPNSAMKLPPQKGSARNVRADTSLQALNSIVVALGRRGVRVSRPESQAFGHSSSFASFADSFVDLILGVRIREGSTCFSLLTFQRAPSSKRKLSSAALDEWTKLCETINQVLTVDLGADSVRRLTHGEAESLWSKKR